MGDFAPVDVGELRRLGEDDAILLVKAGSLRIMRQQRLVTTSFSIRLHEKYSEMSQATAVFRALTWMVGV